MLLDTQISNARMKISKFLNDSKYKWVLIVVLIMGIGIFSIYATSGSHVWGDDFALYLSHARNISEGKSYDDTGLILHEFAPTYSPQNYPPGFPLILAPIYSITGLNFYYLKIFIICWFLLLLWLIWIYFKDKIQFPWLFVILLIIGLSPFFRDQKENILADLPAACFILLVFIMDEKRRLTKSKYFFLFLFALVIWFGAAIRVTGLLVLPAILLFELIQYKKISRESIIVTITVAGLMVIQSLLMPSSDYMNILLSEFEKFSPNIIADNSFGRANNYIRSFTNITHLSFITRLNTNLNELIFWIFHITAAVGFYRKASNKFSPLELFVVFYMLLIFVFPGYQGTRYLIPIIPFYFFYSMYCLQGMKVKWVSNSLIGVLLLSLTFIYIDDHNRMPRHEIPDGVQSKSAEETYQFIRENTSDDAVLMCTKPRAFSLFTNRDGIVFPNAEFKDQFYNLLERENVLYVVSGKFDYFPYIKEEINAHPEVFQQIFSNDLFSIYLVNNL